MSNLQPSTAKPLLRDAHGRTISYLRLSVTDRCNLKCLYCAPHAERMRFIPHDSILRYEEMLRLIRAAVSFGVKKVRLTGGEPFTRKDFISFVRDLRSEHPELILGITTNGTLLRPHIQALQELKLNSLNISLDTFRPDLFNKITGEPLLSEVLSAIQAGQEAGLTIKINAVALRGVNDGELPAFLDFARKHPVEVRFIEYMPMGGRGKWTEDNFWSADDILQQAQKLVELTPLREGEEWRKYSGPAKLYALAGGRGRFGIITPVSQHFCGLCNRLRVTADGKLRVCLFSDQEYLLTPALRGPEAGEEALYQIFAEANKDKPLGTELLQRRQRREAVIERRMSAIGG